MAVTFEPVTFDGTLGDEEGRLVLREGRLIAIVARLGEMHEELVGRWFVEVSFTEAISARGETYPDLPAIAALVTG